MENQEPTNKELAHYLKDIKDTVGEIKIQVKATNGRVNALENWKWFITGGLTIIAFMVIPILLKLFGLKQ